MIALQEFSCKNTLARAPCVLLQENSCSAIIYQNHPAFKETPWSHSKDLFCQEWACRRSIQTALYSNLWVGYTIWAPFPAQFLRSFAGETAGSEGGSARESKLWRSTRHALMRTTETGARPRSWRFRTHGEWWFQHRHWRLRRAPACQKSKHRQALICEPQCPASDELTHEWVDLKWNHQGKCW